MARSDLGSDVGFPDSDVAFPAGIGISNGLSLGDGAGPEASEGGSLNLCGSLRRETPAGLIPASGGGEGRVLIGMCVERNLAFFSLVLNSYRKLEGSSPQHRPTDP